MSFDVSTGTQISPGKNDNFPSIYLPDLPLHPLVERALASGAASPGLTASHQVSVRQARSLPPASFRFRLAADTLASSYRKVQPLSFGTFTL
jgi:hypothetical protein